MFHYEINTNNLTVEDLLRNHWRLGKKIVHELRMAKAITTIDGEPIQWNDPLHVGTIIKFTFPIPTSNYQPTPVCAIDIVYEDDHCLIVSKPKGMSTHPNDARDTHTCMNHVMAHI
ncbi:RluA family pseudouridine synthase, partial [Lysinibacillus xylanilyticus]